jgi:hypothetical protein
MSALIGIVSAVVAGGAAGWLSSVFSAGPVARRQEFARQRVNAEQAIARVVTEYLGRIRAFELNPQFIYPEDYASLCGREHLAEDVLALLPSLKADTAWEVRRLLAELVGNVTMEAGTARVGVPDDARMAPELQAGQYEVTDRKVRLGYHRGVGCKQELYRFCEQEHYPQVRDDYGWLGLLWLVQGHPHSSYRPEAQAEAIMRLRAILDWVQPKRLRDAERFRIQESVHTALGR